jgi:serine phosphatase RsbU (regulator of sigma subunit)
MVMIKIEKRLKETLFIIISFVAIIFLDVHLLSKGIITFSPVQSREFIFVIIYILLGWMIFSFNWLKGTDLLRKLQLLGGAIIILWFWMSIISRLKSFPSFISISDLFSGKLLITGIYWAGIFLSVIIFVVFKALIYIQQGKKTTNNFRLLFIVIVFQMITMIIAGDEGKNWSINLDSWQQHFISTNLFYSLFIFLSIINGFRCKWIHYLNKTQKLNTLFYGVLILPIHFFTFQKLPGLVRNYSTVLGICVEDLMIFIFIYVAMSLLGILFHLPSAGLMDRRKKEIQSLQTLSAMINTVFDMEEFIAKATELSQKFVNADFTWLELKQSSGYYLAGTKGIGSDEIEQIPDSIMRFIRKEVIRGKNTLLINDLIKDKRIKEIKKWKNKAGSLLAAPVHLKKKDLGILYAVKRETFGFVEESQGLFQSFADQVAVALENVHLVKVTIEQERYREELRLAHEAQMRLLPKEMPRIDGIELDGFCLTANDVGGDFYDIIKVNENRLDIVVGDVSGKGAAAAFYMAELKGMTQSLAPHFSNPKNILIEMNTFLYKHFEPDKFVTLVYGIYLPLKKQIQLVRAGHPPVGLIRKKTVSWFETPGLGLGLAPSEIFEQRIKTKNVILKKDDTVIFYTDGITEARNALDEEYGEESFTETLINLEGYESKEMLNEIRNRLNKFTKDVSRHDDMTVVAIRALK